MERVAYVLVSLWRHPLCVAKRFETLPQPRITLTQSTHAPAVFTTIPLSNTSDWRAMYGKTSRDAKQQFVKWLATSNFTHAWHFEDDVYARNWTETLSQFRTGGALPDLMGHIAYDPRNFFYRSYKPHSTSRHVVRWPIVLMSRSLARFIKTRRHQRGHHEVMTHDMCLRMGGRCVNVSLPGVRLAAKWMRHRPLMRGVEPAHPLKCTTSQSRPQST